MSYAQNSSAPDQDMQLLLQKLQERDAVIDDLNRRVKLLEGQQQTPGSQQQSPLAADTPANNTQSPESSAAASPPQQTQADAKPQGQANEGSSSGGLEVDEIAAERALERTLIQSGALLLPFRQMEIQPFVTYTRRENDFPVLVTNDFDQLTGVRTGDVKRNEFDAGFFFRAGLPFESQLEFRLPTRIIQQTTSIPQGAANVNDINRTGAALGDISVGLAKTLFRENNWMPDLVGRITWDSASGKIESNDVFMGTGFNEFRFSLTALKRQDPLAFTSRFDYQATLKKNNIKRGDQYIFSLGASLAASPYTSLNMSLQQIWREKTKVSNINVAGSDDVQSIMSFGITSIITRSLFFTLTGGIGLTDASPDYLVNLSFPLRFSR